MTEAPPTVLFLCTGNSARSILGEVLLRDLGQGRFRAVSAGSRPTGRVHPMALEVLRAHGHDISGLRSKSQDELAAPGAPPIDLVVTVCDSAAGEACPVWPGAPLRTHWGLEDPAAVTGDEARQREAFERTYRALRRRIEELVKLDFRALDRDELQRRVDALAALPAD